MAELARATGFGGRGRCFADEAERARVAVRKAIKRALASIIEVEPVLGGEIASRVVTGTRCVFRGAQPGADPLDDGERLRPARR